MEQEVIGDIARRVKKTGRYTETAELMAKSMMENGYSPAKIRAEVMRKMRADKALQDEISKNTREYKQFVTDEIKATVKAAKEAGDDLISEAGMMAYNNDLSMWSKAGQDLSKPNSLSQIMAAMKAQTVCELRNLTRSTGFKGLAFESIKNAYQLEMDKALVKVASGAYSYDQAVNDCVKALAQSGLRSIDYASGRSYQLDTAARMSVRTGLSQLSGKITEANIESTGVNLVITSQHMGSRPEHAVWQNKVFCYKGKSRKYPNFEEGTGYGTAAGLKGVNCTHDFYPFWEGISVKEPDLKEPSPVTVDGKTYDYYKATQKQRSMERGIRATKREIEAQKAIGGDTTDLRASLRKQSADYHKFSADVGIRAKDNRLRVVGGSSDKNKTKAYSAMKKSINKSQGRFDNDIVMSRKGNTHRKVGDNGIVKIDEPTYNKLTREVKKNGGIIIRGSDEVEEHLRKNGSTASCIGDVLLFSKDATVSDVLEETYHFKQNHTNMNNHKKAQERYLLNEIDAQKYLISVADKYNIPEAERIVTQENLKKYEKGLEEYYESKK